MTDRSKPSPITYPDLPGWTFYVDRQVDGILISTKNDHKDYDAFLDDEMIAIGDGYHAHGVPKEVIMRLCELEAKGAVSGYTRVAVERHADGWTATEMAETRAGEIIVPAPIFQAHRCGYCGRADCSYLRGGPCEHAEDQGK